MSNFDRVLSHLGHELEVAVYGDNENVAIECLTCMEVVVDYNNAKQNTMIVPTKMRTNLNLLGDDDD